jgi:hypothetical protein
VAAIILIAVGVLALLVLALTGALLELYRDVRQMRDALGILDRPLVIDSSRVVGKRPSEVGLPSELDSAASALVLFLSERCTTCRAIAAGLARPLAEGLWIVVEGRSASAAEGFLDTYALRDIAPEGRVIVDVEDRIVARLGLNLSPAGFRVEHGRFAEATTVPSSRYLQSILPEPIRLRSVG